MKIYTKSGDKGKTSIIGGQRISKADPRVHAYGSIDEVNAWLGEIITQLNEPFLLLQKELIELQVLLFDIGTDLATPEGIREYIVNQEHLLQIEKLIDHYNAKIPPIEKFILPGGHLLASHFHVARTVTRRAEREITQLISEGILINLHAYKVVNRLSDLFFVLARYMNHVFEIEEPFYERAGNVFIN
ncbi:MAG: cob(I)yrinic acid a,c-diamide adenosyltransferase [Enterococcus lemanii]|jgi:cob(I)alamin adenosyltransferase